ncbi:YggU family protein, partial [Enterobacter hormaechei]
MSAVRPCAEGVFLGLYIHPKPTRDSIVGLHGDELKVAITA